MNYKEKIMENTDLKDNPHKCPAYEMIIDDMNCFDLCMVVDDYAPIRTSKLDLLKIKTHNDEKFKEIEKICKKCKWHDRDE